MKVNYQIPKNCSDNDVQDTVKKKDIYKYNSYGKNLKKDPKKEYKNIVTRLLVNEIDLDMIRPQRAGVIMYTKHNNYIYYGLGIDTLSGEYTDFGGGISYKDKKDKNVIMGALREYKEETLAIFGDLTYDDVKDSTVIYNNHNLILFKYVEVDPSISINMFLIEYNKKLNEGEIPEVCDIKWVSTREFKELISTRGKMFYRVQCFLQQAGDFTRFL
jgi:hypothetical protein